MLFRPRVAWQASRTRFDVSVRATGTASLSWGHLPRPGPAVPAPLRLVGMDRSHAPYMHLRPGKPRRRRRMFRTAKLNIVGWAAVVGSCLAAAGLGFVTGRLLGLPIAVIAPAAALLPLAVLAAADRRKWRAMLAGYGWGGTEAEVSAVVAELLRRGVVANVAIWGEDESASLQYRNADTKAVETVLAQHGIPPIDHRL